MKTHYKPYFVVFKATFNVHCGIINFAENIFDKIIQSTEEIKI